MTSSSGSRRLVIDTDTASDDAVALMMATHWPGVVIDAVTTVAGNVDLEQATQNALFTLEICESTVPVFKGSAEPLERKAAPADWFHGEDGMGNMHYPNAKQIAEAEPAVDFLQRHFSESPGEIDLITLGPLSNIALAIKADSSFASNVRHCYVMGGAACTNGNVTAAAEYNIWCDPEAAKIVFHSGMAITMIGWELSCADATLNDAELQAIHALGTERARVAVDCNRHALKAVMEIQGESGLALADPVAMAVALDPRVCEERSSHYVDIATAEELTRGMTVVDKLGVSGQNANVSVCWTLDSERWKGMLMTCLAD